MRYVDRINSVLSIITLCREQVPRRRCQPTRAILKYCNRVRDISGPSHASAGSRLSVRHDFLDHRDISSKGQAVRQPPLRVFHSVLFSYLDVMSTVFCRTCNQVEPYLLQTEKIYHIYVCQHRQIYQPRHITPKIIHQIPTNHLPPCTITTYKKKNVLQCLLLLSSWNHHGS